MTLIQFIERVFWTMYGRAKALASGRKTYSMAIVRRYTDANGAFVGELYLLGTFAGVLGYQMIGMSLDTLPFTCSSASWVDYDLDVDHNFLDPMPNGCVRVGAQDPQDTDAVRQHVRRLAYDGHIELQVHNRFVEHVMSKTFPGKGDK